MDDVISELVELIENDVIRIFGERMTGVVNFLDVAFRAGCADDILRFADPTFQPYETFLTHAFGEHTAAAEDTRNRDTAATVVSCRWPNRPVSGRVELACDEPWHEATIGGKHLMRPNHGKPVADGNDDLRVDTRQLRGEDDMRRYIRQRSSVLGVVPMDAVKICRIWCVGVDVVNRSTRSCKSLQGVCKFREER